MNINFCNLVTSAALMLSSTAPVGSITEQRVSSIYTIESLQQIQVTQPDNTIFFFDLDDTIFDFPYMLGSKAWRRYIVEATKKFNTSKNWHDIFSYLLAQRYRIQAVEPITSQFVKELQKKGYIVCGLTSRERKQWYKTPQEGVDEVTSNQLNSIDIHFDNEHLKNHYPYLASDSGYFNGTFFAHLDPKGEYLLHLFKNASDLPKKVIFIDDKSTQVESVAKALTELGIENECYFYSATDEKAKRFNPLIANIQLYYFLKSDYREIISDEQAALIAKEDLTKDVDHYLKAILEMGQNL